MQIHRFLLPSLRQRRSYPRPRQPPPATGWRRPRPSFVTRHPCSFSPSGDVIIELAPGRCRGIMRCNVTLAQWTSLIRFHVRSVRNEFDWYRHRCRAILLKLTVSPFERGTAFCSFWDWILTETPVRFRAYIIEKCGVRSLAEMFIESNFLVNQRRCLRWMLSASIIFDNMFSERPLSYKTLIKNY